MCEHARSGVAGVSCWALDVGVDHERVLCRPGFNTILFLWRKHTLAKCCAQLVAGLPLERLCSSSTPPRAWCRIETGAMGCFVKLLSPTSFLLSRLCVCPVLLRMRHRTCVF